MRGVYVKCTPDSTVSQREDIINGLKSFVRDSRAIITNMKDILESMAFATFALDLFFNVIASIIVIMCFFMLIISFTSNITENAWEFGVLRALGLTVCRCVLVFSSKQAYQVVRVYIYEGNLFHRPILINFSVGARILFYRYWFCHGYSEYSLPLTYPGDLVSITLSAESNLFTELPFTFKFPALLFVTVALLSICVAICGSYIPARVLLKKRIAVALKNTS